MKAIAALALILSIGLGFVACALSSTTQAPTAVTQVPTPTSEIKPHLSPTTTVAATPTRIPRPTPIPTLEIKNTWPKWSWNVVAGPSPDIEYIGDADGKRSVWGKLEEDESISLWISGEGKSPQLIYHLPADHGIVDMHLKENKIFWGIGTSSRYWHTGIIHQAFMAYDMDTHSLDMVYEENNVSYRSELPAEAYDMYFESSQTHLVWMTLPDAEGTRCFQAYDIASGFITSGPCVRVDEAVVTSPVLSWPFLTYVYRDLRTSPPCQVLHIYNMETQDKRIVEGFEKCQITKGVANHTWVMWSELDPKAPNLYYSPMYAQNLVDGTYYRLGYGRARSLVLCEDSRFVWAYQPREGGTNEIRSWIPGARFIEKIYRSPDRNKNETYATSVPKCSNGGIVLSRKAYWKPEKPGEILYTPLTVSAP